jgi:hypothetical protein
MTIKLGPLEYEKHSKCHGVWYWVKRRNARFSSAYHYYSLARLLEDRPWSKPAPPTVAETIEAIRSGLSMRKNRGYKLAKPTGLWTRAYDAFVARDDDEYKR